MLVAAVSGAIARYVVDHGGDPLDLTTMVPVNLRPLDQPLPRELGNQFALVMLPLPTGVRAPLQRLSESKRGWTRSSSRRRRRSTFGLINAIGRTNPDIAQLLVDFFAAKAIGVTTNVAGPLAARYLAGSRDHRRPRLGARLRTADASACASSATTGRYGSGFKVDAGVVPDAEKLVHAFDDEMDELLRLAQAA